jgi:hypothetical protein
MTISVPLPQAYRFSRASARRTRRADDADDRIEIVERDLEAFQNVLALARLPQQEDRAPLHHVDPVIDEDANRLIEAQLPRLPVQHRQEDHREAALHLVCL